MVWEKYKRSKPRSVEGGIKLRSRKDMISNNWWGKRWIEALESFEDAGRLSRGRSYARKGQIVDIHIAKGKIVAKVQGSRAKPYQVTIELENLTPQAWNLVIDALAHNALCIARLLAGELPKEIEGIFQEVNILLLPSHYADLSTDCTCPDWSNPCKHIAAVLYLLGEEFGRDPFLLFKVRGMERETFLRKLEEISSIDNHLVESEDLLDESAFLSVEGEFWSGNDMPLDWLANAFMKSTQNATILKSLGKFPFWRGEEDLVTCLEPIYSHATQFALELLLEQD